MLAPFIDDTFSGGADGDPLAGHVGETGAAWEGGGFALAAGRAYASGAGVAVASGRPPCADYAVTALLESLSTSSGRTSVGVLGRWDGAAGYEARYSAANLVQLWRHGAASDLLAQVSVTPPLVGAPAVALTLRLACNSIEVWWAGARVAREVDGSVMAAGRAGLRSLAAGAAGGGQQVAGFQAAGFECQPPPRHPLAMGALRRRLGRR